MSERKGKIHEGGTVAPDGTHYPTVLIEVEADEIVDVGSHVEGLEQVGGRVDPEAVAEPFGTRR